MTRSNLDALLERRNLTSRDRLATLSRSVELIERKLGGIGHAVKPTRGNLTADPAVSSFEELEQRVRVLAAEMNHQHEAAKSSPAVLGGSAAAGPSDAVAEIARRKNMLNMVPQEPVPRPVGAVGINVGPSAAVAMPEFDILSAELRELNDKLDDLRYEVGDGMSGIRDSVSHAEQPSSSGAELDRIAEGIRELQQAPRFDPSAFDALHNELDDLRSSLGSTISKEDIGNNFEDINSRLDQITVGLPQFGQHEIENLQSRVDTLASGAPTAEFAALVGRIETLNQTVENLSGSLELEKLDQRLHSLVEAVDHLAKKSQDGDPLGSNMEAIESRLDEITRAIVAVSVNGSSDPAAASPVLERMEQQIGELAQYVELVAIKRDDKQLDLLNQRIESLSHQMEALDTNLQNTESGLTAGSVDATGVEAQLQQLASRLDMDAAGKQHDENQIARLAERIENLIGRFGAFESVALSDERAVPVPVMADNSQVEYQLQQLAERLDAAVGSNSSDIQLANLETQIADISGKLDIGEQLTPDFTGLENRLGQIEQRMAADRELTLNTITKSAETSMDSQNLPVELISALSEDLKALRTIADQKDDGSDRAIRSVQHTLGNVAVRLDSIESKLQGTPQSKASSIAAARHAKRPQKAPASSETVSSSTAPVVKNVIDAPPIDLADSLKVAEIPREEDNRPLEPGTGVPDIPALVKRASEKFRQPSSDSETPTDKMDFIAAARRAAKSAAADANAVDGEQIMDEEPTEQAPTGSAFAGLSRRPVIVVAASVLMLLLAFAGSKLLLQSDAETELVSLPASSSVGQQNATTAVNESTVQPATPVDSNNTSGDTAAPAPGGTNTDGKGTTRIVTGIPESQPDRITNLQDDTTTPPLAADQSSVKLEAAAPSTGEEGLNGQLIGGPLPDEKFGPPALRQAAATGDAKAQYEIGLRYTNGSGIKRDMTQAAEWFSRSAAQEFAPAQYRLGSLYEKGLGVERDLVSASNWYRRSAELGNARAMHNLAVIHTMGADGNPDMAQALDWFNKAANKGVKDSQYNLGILYGQGMGTVQNLAESYKWFALAAKTGDVDSIKKRDEVANVMDPKNLEKARLTVDEWRPEPLDQSTNRVTIPEEWRQDSATASISAVKQAQSLLNKLGFDVGTPDGLMGPKTRRAIMGFQKKAGLAQTGIVDAELVKALKSISV